MARTSNSDLLLARLELLAEEEAWQPLLVCAETETAQLAVLGFDISQAGELWVVGRGVREVTTQFLLSSDWSGASPSWSVLTCPHLLSPPSSLCPPLSRPVLLPASRLWASSGVSTPSPPSSGPGWTSPPWSAPGSSLARPGSTQEGRRPTLATSSVPPPAGYQQEDPGSHRAGVFTSRPGLGSGAD